MPSPETDSRAALDRFLADDPELEQLSARLATFNIFRALKIERVEIRHSNVLGWLLDPQESHGLGDVVLRRVLSNMLLESQVAQEGISAAEVELMQFRDIEVRREHLHTDLLIIDRANHLVWLIENKVKSQFSRKQLERYRAKVTEEFPGFRVVAVLLTLVGDPDAEEETTVVSYSYAQVLTTLERILEQRASQLTEAVSTFLEHYLDALRGLTMQDEALAQLCQTIYRRHREAIDLIVELGRVSVFQQVAHDVLVERGGYEILAVKPKNVWFLPEGWAKVVPENGTIWKHLSRPVSVACWLWCHQNNKLRLVFEISRMDEPDLRLDVVRQLDEAGFKLTKNAFKRDAVYSRFYNATASVTDLADEEAVRETVGKLLDRAKEKFAQAQEVLAGVFG